MKYAHFVITQFNLRNFQLSDKMAYEKWVKWTGNRISIFKSHCLPSIINQTQKNFTWLLYFDTSTPSDFNEFIASLGEFSFIKICRVDGFNSFFSDYMNQVESLIQDKEWVMTTRVDNDDCLHREAISFIHENFVEKHNYLISLASGYILNISDNTLSHYFYPMSPFITLIENRKINLEGIYSKGHTKWDDLRLFISKEIFGGKNRKARFILSKPLWIQLYHGENVSNSFYRGLPVLTSRDLSEFSIGNKTKPMPVASIFKYAHYVTWKRYFKSFVVKTLLRK
jgi:hypothetical protein